MIGEYEASGLPLQGILPKKTITIAKHRCLEKDSCHCACTVVSLLLSSIPTDENSVPRLVQKLPHTEYVSRLRFIDEHTVATSCGDKSMYVTITLYKFFGPCLREHPISVVPRVAYQVMCLILYSSRSTTYIR